MTCGDPADPTTLHRSHFRGAAFTSPFAEEAAGMQLTGMGHRQTPRELTHNSQRVNRYSRQLNVGLP